jgi:hypothetical protein
MSLSPPFEGHFTSRFAAFEYAQAHAKANGYAIVIRSSSKKAFEQLDLVCNRAGVYNSKGTGKRKVSSKKCGCLFKLSVIPDSGNGLWHLKVRQGLHNGHEATAPNAHPVHRKLTQDDKNFIAEQRRHNRSTLNILKLLNARKGLPVGEHLVYKDVDNVIQQMKRRREEDTTVREEEDISREDQTTIQDNIPQGTIPHGPIPHGPIPHGPIPQGTMPQGNIPLEDTMPMEDHMPIENYLPRAETSQSTILREEDRMPMDTLFRFVQDNRWEYRIQTDDDNFITALICLNGQSANNSDSLRILPSGRIAIQAEQDRPVPRPEIRRPPTCSVCNNSGHRRNTPACPQFNR